MAVPLLPNVCVAQQDGALARKVTVLTLTSAPTVATVVANICATTRPEDTRARAAPVRTPPRKTLRAVLRAPLLSIAWQLSAQHQTMQSAHFVPTAMMSTSTGIVSMLTNVLAMITVAATRCALTKKVPTTARATTAFTAQRPAVHALLLRIVLMCAAQARLITSAPAAHKAMPSLLMARATMLTSA